MRRRSAGAPPPSRQKVRAVTGLTEIEGLVSLDELAEGVAGVHSRRKLASVVAPIHSEAAEGSEPVRQAGAARDDG